MIFLVLCWTKQLDTTVLATGLTNSTDYFWRVQSNNTIGGARRGTDVQTKAVDASVPVLISPVSGSVDTDTTITLIWSSAVGALEYHYETSDASDLAQSLLPRLVQILVLWLMV